MCRHSQLSNKMLHKQLLCIASGLTLVLSGFAMAREGALPEARHWGPQAGAFRLSISSDKPRYVAGEPIKIVAVLQNVTSGRAYTSVISTVVGLYEIDISPTLPRWLPFKPRAVLTPFGRDRMYQTSGNVAGIPLFAGAEIKEEFELNKLYEMSLTGEYHITFHRRQRPEGPEEPFYMIHSNEITVSVVASKEAR